MAANDLAVILIVFSARALVPVTLLRWPFWGALGCILADATDTMIQDAVGSDILSRGANYHVFDKAFDTYYLSWEALVAWRWVDPLARWTALDAVRATADRRCVV